MIYGLEIFQLKVNFTIQIFYFPYEKKYPYS